MAQRNTKAAASQMKQAKPNLEPLSCWQGSPSQASQTKVGSQQDCLPQDRIDSRKRLFEVWKTCMHFHETKQQKKPLTLTKKNCYLFG